MDFSSLTSLTGGGGLDASSSASADGDNTNASDFNYRGGNINFGDSTPPWVYVVGGIAMALLLLKAVK